MHSTKRHRLIDVLRTNDLTDTGKREVSGFHEVDIAFGNFITDLIDGFCINEPDAINAAFHAYCERPKAEKVVMGRFDDVNALLTHIRRAREKDKDNGNQVQLPLVNISRNFMVTYGNGDRAIADTHTGDFVYNDKKEIIGVTASVPATLTYDLWVVGADKESTSLLINALAAEFSLMLNTGFKAHTRIATGPAVLDCGIDGVRNFMMNDTSPDSEFERLYVGATQLNVITSVLIVYNVTHVRSRVRVMTPETMPESSTHE